MSQIRRVFRHARFAERTTCIACSSRKISVTSDGRFLCRACGTKFSLTTSTYLAHIRLPLDSIYELLYWFAYEFTAHKTAQEVRLPQRLVHRCFSVIRKAITDYEEAQMEKFFGEVEVDETYIGPKFKNRRKKNREKLRHIRAVKRGRGAKNLLQPVFGIYQRNDTVYVKFVKDTGARMLQDIIKGKIVLESNVYSDTWPSYQGLRARGYRHETIDHGREEYFRRARRRKVHINGIEGFWGYMKERLIKHHGVSERNLIYYVKEQEFRFNHRYLSTDEFVQKIVTILMNFTP